MHRLTRRIRFAINPPGVSRDRGPNGYAGNPPVRGMGAHHEIVVDCVGDLGVATQYVINIKDIDHAFRDAALPWLQARADENPAAEPLGLLPGLVDRLAAACSARVEHVRWHLSPYYALEMTRSDPLVVTIRQKFDFCAAHRLHNAALTPEQNRTLFGKCNNPSAHGHNYQVEPAVAVRLLPSGGSAFTLHHLERLVEDEIIARFDHKNLNADTAEFRDGVGVMPTAEQISRVCFEILRDAIARAGAQAELRSVTVWESERTSATFPA